MTSLAKDPFETLPLLAILRGIREEEVAPVAEIALRCGIPALEVTLNTAHPFERIEQFCRFVQGKMSIGAGTVLDRSGMEQALDAGAEFLVSPVTVPEVAEECRRRQIPYYPGALTPQEVWGAHCAGAAMVKVFPAGAFGPNYLAELKGPFDPIPLMAVGGVEPSNVAAFFKAGASAVACGGSVFRRAWIERREYDRVEEALTELVRAIRAR